MPKPLDPEKRERIELAIRDGGKRNEIAREHGVSGSTVSKIARELEEQTNTDEDEEGWAAFDRSSTKRATEARATDLAGRRAELAERLMDRAFNLERRLDEERIVGWVGSGDDKYPVREKPGGRDSQGFMVAIGIAVDKVGVLTAADGGERGGSLLEGLFEEIKARRTTVPTPAVTDATQ